MRTRHRTPASSAILPILGMEEFRDLISRTIDTAEIKFADTVCLSFAKREKARFKVSLDTGEEIGIKLKRGLVIRGGDFIRGKSGRVLKVIAAREKLSIVKSESTGGLARISYHLGNRHVYVQILANTVVYLRDNVLDDMVRGLGFDLTHEEGPFEPEGGAYMNRGHVH